MNAPRAEGKPVRTLLIEDNAVDARLTSEILKECRVANSIDAVGDGDAAMDYLRGTGARRGAALPDLILLDLNLPRKDGREVLAEIKADPELKKIPVVVLTSSSAEKDIAACYALQANAYIIKPVDLDQFVRVVNSIEEFWLTIVKLPQR